MTDKKTSAEVSAKYARVLFPSVGTYYDEPLAIDSARGMHVRDFDGNEYLDFFCGILTVVVGHAHPRVLEAIRAQLERLGHVSTLYATKPVADFAEKLVGLAPGELARTGRVFFCVSGTEANETAVALAQLRTGCSEFVALRYGYSGRTLAAQALTGHARYRALPTQVPGVKHAHAPYCYRCPFGLTYPRCELRCAEDIEELIQTTTCGSVAGLLVEPILGVGGFITPPEGWLSRAVDIVRKYGGLFLCDEVQTGFGRTGAFWGVDHEGVEPDVMTLAKGIANGMPLSAVVARGDIAASWTAGNIATFGGHPASCAAALATVETIIEDDLVRNAADRGQELRAGLDALKAKYPVIGDVRGRGLMQGVELVANEPAGDRTPAAHATRKVLEETKKRGLLVGRGGLHGNVLRIAPPLIATRGDIDDALTILDQSFAAVSGRHEVAR